MTILILHGITGKSVAYWQQDLHDQLVKRGHTVIMPTLPNPDRPDRAKCLNVVKNLLRDIDHKNLILVGHSLGVPTLLDYVEQSDKDVYGIISVSGFALDTGAELNSYFMVEKDINLNAVKNKVKHIEVLYGDDDPYLSQENLLHTAKGLNVSPKIFAKGGHLNAKSGHVPFPQLVTLTLNMIAEAGTNYIDKLAFLDLKAGQILGTISKGKDTWYIPGGKREVGETDYQALTREVKEELDIDIDDASIRYYDTFTAQAHSKPEGTLVRMTCYTAEYDGEPTPNAEIDKVQYIDYSYFDKTSPVDQLIFSDLKEKGLLK